MDEGRCIHSGPRHWLCFISQLFLPELDFRLSLLLIGLIFIGMPHGAMDIFLLSKSFGQGTKLFVALAAYVLVAAPIVLLWPIFPTTCFIFFVTYSLFHFADSDIQTTGPGRLMEMATRLPLPFCLPYIKAKPSSWFTGFSQISTWPRLIF
jgi:Brp/Blh family beta-carotene 15,15'-monooxygenase